MPCPPATYAVDPCKESRVFPLTANAFRYALSQLAQRAGGAKVRETEHGFSLLEIPVFYESLANCQTIEPAIYIIPTADITWHRLLTRPPDTLDWIPSNDILPEPADSVIDKMPVLFWGAGYDDGSKPFVERREGGTLVFYADIVAATFFMLSRWEETVISTRDQHGRFPATASVAYKQGFLDHPIVDEYALVLQAWLKTLLPGWSPQMLPFSVKLSHDIDHVLEFPSLYQGMRIMARDLLKRHSPSKAAYTLRILFAQPFVPERSPVLQKIDELAAISEQHGFTSAFYFMTAESGLYDSGYDSASQPVRRYIDDLRSRGHEIGFHPGYWTLDDPERFATEKARMDAILGQQQYGGRQHFLRFRTPGTWRMWEQMGLTYDATLGYGDYEGFRCGTCHPFHPFDIEQDRQLDLLEIPLIVMDTTLKEYRGLTPEQGEERILALAQRCQQVNGVFTLLWHNSSLLGAWEPWAAMYRRILPQLSALDSGLSPKL